MQYEPVFELEETVGDQDQWGVADNLAKDLEDSDNFTVINESHGSQYIARVVEDE